jgi:Uncharacterized low-complexity proteins
MGFAADPAIVSHRNTVLTRYWPILAAAVLLGLTAILNAAHAATPIDGVASIKAGNHNCPHCDLKGADLSSQCVKGGDLTGADFSGAKLTLACMSKSNFRGARFAGADLSGANLSESKLDNADFTGAVFSATQARGTDFSRAKGLTEAQLQGACGDKKTRLPAGLTIPMCD